ncbi:MAG TPA: NACHT domain-containing protein [Chloroflexi bacterium]|nr:NACHT domain-containing protein [Chloroflexota bacterium]
MQRKTVLLIPLLLFLVGGLVQAQTPPPTPSSPLSTPAITVTPTAEPVELPSPVGGWWKTAQQLAARYGWWAAIGVICLLIPLYFFWQVGKEVTDEEAKSIAARLRRGVRKLWRRAARRPTPEEQGLLKYVCAACEQLELKGFVKETLIIVSLESVYVPLSAQGEKGPGRLGEGLPLLRAAEGGGEIPLTDLIARHPCLVLVGEAGSGKTTFLKYVAYTAAQCYAKPGSDGADWLPEPRPLPLFLPLHGLGRYLDDQNAAERESPSPDLLRDYVVHHLRHLDLPEGWVAERIKTGGLLLLLDGLDEVARFEDRRFIAELVTRFASYYDRCRVIVTSRPQGYEGAAQLGGAFERRDINPLSWPDDVRDFLYRWNEAIKRREGGGSLSTLGRQQARDNAEQLMTRLAHAPHVRDLANNPLLLTVMAIVHYNVGELPERRADLYDAATELLLGWDKRMGRELQAPPPWLDDLSAAHRRLPLEELAFDFQERRVMEESRADTLSFLTRHFMTGRGPEAEQAALGRAEQYLTWVADRTYVLQEIGAAIRFYRKPFQEYLAARKLARLPDLSNRVQHILREDWRDRWWDETLLLAVGQLITDDPPRANELLISIQGLDSPVEAPHYPETFVARALADVPEGLLSHVWQVREEVVAHLAEAVSTEDDKDGGPAFAPPARLEAGVALGALGDPRPGSGVIAVESDPHPLPDILWAHVPAGPFLMGSTDAEVDRWLDWIRRRIEDGTEKAAGFTQEQLLEIYTAWLEAERGQYLVETAAFLIGRYPVTNAQYRCFVDAGGYDDPTWWGGEEGPAWAWRTGKPRWDWQRTDRPDFWGDPRFDGPNQPVVGVTWYEAAAYCRWLEERLRMTHSEWRIWRDGKIETHDSPATFTVRLPSEAEWEKAARGTDGRTWPWGNEWDAARVNVEETNLERPSPVGILPGGHSPYGVADAVGSVWEWTQSLWGPDWQRPTFGYPYRPDDGREETTPGDEMLRVVRGGSWGANRSVARCASRFRRLPGFSYDLSGFRCVSPVLF